MNEDKQAIFSALGGVLLEIGDTACRIRLYSSYAPLDYPYAITPEEARDDLLILSDALHVFGDLGASFQKGEKDSIRNSCDQTLSYLQMFIPDNDGNYPAAKSFSKIKDFDAAMKRCLHRQLFRPERLANSIQQLKGALGAHA